MEEGLATQSLFNPDYAHQHLLSSGYLPALGIAIPWTVHVLSLHVISSICTPIALVECMFPDRRTTPWLRTPGLIIIEMIYVLGVVATFAVTWATYRYVAPTGHLIAASILVVAPWIPKVIGSTLTFLVIEALAVIRITLWLFSRPWRWQQCGSPLAAADLSEPSSAITHLDSDKSALEEASSPTLIS